MNINKHRHVNSARLERWLGRDRVEELSANFKTWYGPPVLLRDVPGNVLVTPGGDFIGDFSHGGFGSAMDSLRDHVKRFWRELGRPQYGFANVGFASISDAFTRASQGFEQNIGPIAKTGPTGVASVASTLWRVGTAPAAGATPPAAPAGAAPTKATTGAIGFNNAASGTLHLTGADFGASVLGNSLLVYDRIFHVAKTMNSTTAEAVTGVPTRYQNTTLTAADSIAGNFLMIEVGGTALAATAHNWTAAYSDQANAASTLPSVTGNASAIVDRLDHPAGMGSWFCPLETGDVGIKALTSMTCSAAVATGAVNFVIGHPIGVMAFPIASMLTPFNWLSNRSLAPRIFNDACLALLELPKPSTTAATYSGMLYINNAAP